MKISKLLSKDSDYIKIALNIEQNINQMISKDEEDKIFINFNGYYREYIFMVVEIWSSAGIKNKSITINTNKIENVDDFIYKATNKIKNSIPHLLI